MEKPKVMTEQEWNQDFARCLGVFLAGEALGESDERGQPVADQNFVVLFNAHHDDIAFTLPPCLAPCQWLQIVDTFDPDTEPRGYDGLAKYPLRGRSLAVLMQIRGEPASAESALKLRRLLGGTDAL